jgi:hypothetical protein
MGEGGIIFGISDIDTNSYGGNSLCSLIEAPLIGYNSRSFAGNILFVGGYGSWCSSRTVFTVSSIMLMWNLANF